VFIFNDLKILIGLFHGFLGIFWGRLGILPPVLGTAGDGFRFFIQKRLFSLFCPQPSPTVPRKSHEMDKK
jgi:hypothetical protein